MTLRFAGCFIASLAVLLIPTMSAAASDKGGLAPSGIYDPSANCIHDETGLPKAPTVAGDQFVVFSPTGSHGVAVTVAKGIRVQDLFGIYERGLGIPSLLQPGQPGPFPVFVDPGIPPDSPYDGIFTKLCEHRTWSSLVVGAAVGSQDKLSGIVEHELFHAAQYALMQELTTSDNWWFEATATAAEVWFGSKEQKAFDSALIDEPGKPMDTFQALDPHQYGAYLVVQWILGSAALPNSAGWAFLRDSIQSVRSAGPTHGVNSAIVRFSGDQTLGAEVASFWADHTNATPKFGPPVIGALVPHPVNEPSHSFLVPAPAPLGANVMAFKPAAPIQQLEVTIHKLPKNLELWVNHGDGTYSWLSPGESMDETFCRSGYIDGSYALPNTADVRMALTTTGGTGSPPAVQIKTLTSTTPCPQPLLIVPGLDVGPLHLGMSVSKAGKTATFKYEVAGFPQNVTGGIVDLAVYDECAGGAGQIPSAGCDVTVGFFNGRITAMWIGGRRFITTTGISAIGIRLEPGLPPRFINGGSTEDEFVSSAPAVQCTSYKSSLAETGMFTNKGFLCDYQEPSKRFTFAFGALTACSKKDLLRYRCGLPRNDNYVWSIGIATKKGFALLQPYITG